MATGVIIAAWKVVGIEPPWNPEFEFAFPKTQLAIVSDCYIKLYKYYKKNFPDKANVSG